jgi:hypothetical protein
MRGEFWLFKGMEWVFSLDLDLRQSIFQLIKYVTSSTLIILAGFLVNLAGINLFLPIQANSSRSHQYSCQISIEFRSITNITKPTLPEEFLRKKAAIPSG